MSSDPPRDWRFVAGVSLIVLACAMPLGALALPLFDLPATHAAALAGILVAGGPEVLILLAAAVLGRENFDRIVGAAQRFVVTAFFSRPVSKPRYYFGVALSLVTMVPVYLAGYVPMLLPTGEGRIVVLAVADLLFILSIFIMGGEFWGKFRRLFVWEGKV
jgi:hypothetical protein